MKIRYNAPVTLTFALASTVILAISQVIPDFMSNFVVPGSTYPFNFFSLDLLRLISYTIGHGSWEHLIGNMSFMLLIGPVLEEKYGSVRIFIMMVITAVASGLFNVFFLPDPSLGASGIVFMLILLISITNVRKGEIPLTLIAVIAVFVTKEIFSMLFEKNNINEIAHLLGGLFGGFFGFLFAHEKKQKETTPEKPAGTNVSYTNT
ncbi:MAG: rhomboid family intramembrane serine protease [Spirochaetaceae bacterium]|nr:MAG: rhomboid family intramembrane serine protease [Spirochaetaceae bacterium]